MFAAAMLEEKNNRIPFHWEKSFIFMQIVFIVLLLQHGCHEHTLYMNLGVSGLRPNELPAKRGPIVKDKGNLRIIENFLVAEKDDSLEMSIGNYQLF